MRIIVTILVLFFLGNNGYSQHKKELTPQKSFAKVTLSGKKNYTYYALSEKRRTEYAVVGPGKLYLNFRVRLVDIMQSEPIRVKYLKSSKFISTFEIPALIASNLKFKSKSLLGVPSKPYRLEIEVPPGRHIYTFYKYETEQKVHIRAFYKKYPKPDWLTIKPVNNIPIKTIKYTETGTEKTYYQITKDKGFDFTVTDSTHLRIIARPEFTFKMLDEIVLKLRLKNLTTGESTTYKMYSKKSSAIIFPNDNETTPGYSSIFYLELDKPKGKEDQYSINLIKGSKAAIIKVSKISNFTN